MKNKAFLWIGIFWLVIILGFIASKEYTLRTGQEVLLKTRPVDPRDLFRGDYVTLDYDISTLDLRKLDTDSSSFDWHDDVYVAIEIRGGYGIATGIYKNMPKEGIFMKGEVNNPSNTSMRIEYGIESYFVPEGQGHDIERERNNLSVKISLDKSGNAVIKSVFIGGKEVSSN